MMGGMGIGHGIHALLHAALLGTADLPCGLAGQSTLWQPATERARPTRSAPGRSAQRYARGEITREQYEIMKQDIDKSKNRKVKRRELR